MTARTRRRRKESVKQNQVKIIRVARTVVGEEPEELVSDEQMIDTQIFETDPAYVRVNAGVTKSIGNYESLRVDVSISTPCYKEEVEELVPVIGDMVADLMQAEVDKYFDLKED